ncbi:MAG: hypothetical protein PVG60_06510 [Desulfarculaceae bacterium]|jgi:hypothetical protein
MLEPIVSKEPSCPKPLVVCTPRIETVWEVYDRRIHSPWAVEILVERRSLCCQPVKVQRRSE